MPCLDLGLNLQWGFTGLINFGHIAFMTLGAYTTVLLSLKGVPLFISAVIGAIVAALLGLIIGFATLRLREDYLVNCHRWYGRTNSFGGQ